MATTVKTSPKEFKTIIRLHKKWLGGKPGGVRANMSGANMSGEDMRDADMRYANMSGAIMSEGKIKIFCYLGRIYRYYSWAVKFEDGGKWVRMGCLWMSLEDWDKVGIRNSNPAEFPDDGSKGSRQRVLAFEFAKATLAIACE